MLSLQYVQGHHTCGELVSKYVSCIYVRVRIYVWYMYMCTCVCVRIYVWYMYMCTCVCVRIYVYGWPEP